MIDYGDKFSSRYFGKVVVIGYNHPFFTVKIVEQGENNWATVGGYVQFWTDDLSWVNDPNIYDRQKLMRGWD
ncbi:hypothetical protein Arno162_50 [Pectobacterium phage Arno162]|jgi:predicted class III extradiol MEMO1 family dioxygenase|uniref:Uncharacterized protein n=2 Tax=Arnovirus TaxID=3425109 RepID=A0A678ZZH5_9CAUD|nr:hypothetical protein Arno162_50 [Pectobacterium phage Arno162]AZV02236.1 hypothetical protein Arno18_50 [Pectobacterium phage Arno18]